MSVAFFRVRARTGVVTPPDGTAPTITGFSPSSAQVGATVTVLGSNFVDGQEMRVGGVIASIVTVVSSGTATLVVPTGAFSGKIRVTTPFGFATSVADFIVEPPPPTPGTYSDAVHAPWDQIANPAGVTYDSSKGWLVGEPFDTSFVLPTGTPVVVDSSGTEAEREARLQPILDAALNGTGTPVIYCAGPVSWGNIQTRENTRSDGQWVYLLDDRFRTGTFPRMPASPSAIEAAYAQIAMFTPFTPAWQSAVDAFGALVTQARVTPSDMTNAPKLSARQYNKSALFLNPRSVAKFRLVGFECKLRADYAATLAPAADSAGTISTYYGFICDEEGGSGPSHTPGTNTWGSDFIIDRCYIHGEPTKAYGFGLRLRRFERFAILNSRMEHIHQATLETKGMAFDWGGAGWVFRNNYIGTGQGMSILFGGNTALASEVPTDLLFELNQWDFPPAYAAAGLLQKNVFETKFWRRACIQRNEFTNYRSTGLLGQAHAVALKSSNQYNEVIGQNTECVDTRLRLNNWHNCDQALALIYSDETSLGQRRTEVSHNAMINAAATNPQSPTGTVIITNRGADSISTLRLWYNTIIQPASSRDYPVVFQGLNLDKNAVVVRGNIAGAPTNIDGGHWFISSGDGLLNATAWNNGTRTNGSEFAANLITNAGGGTISGNTYVASLAALGVNADATLAGGSPAIGAGDLGQNLGCDIALVKIATAGVRTN